MTALPTGTVAFLFTDIEGSTRLWEQQPQAMRAALAQHDALLRQGIEAHGGHVFKTMGDAFCTAFADSPAAVQAATAAQRALQQELPQIRVRMAIHTGEAEAVGGDYFGPALNRVARLLAAGHGGQILLSRATVERLPAAGRGEISVRGLGEHRLRDLAVRETVFQLLAPGLPAAFPPLNTLDVAFRRGALRAAAVAAAVLVVVAGMALLALGQARLARERERTACRYLYVAHMNVAQQAMEAGNFSRAGRLVEAHRPKQGEEDLRSFEWRYLWRLSRDNSLCTFTGHHNDDDAEEPHACDHGPRLLSRWQHPRLS